MAAGFDRCGIAAAGRIPGADFLAEWFARGYAGTMDYLAQHRDSRGDVRAWLPWAKSVIVVALNYAQPEPPAGGPIGDAGCGRVAMYAWGEDYHLVLRQRLDALVERMHELFAGPFQTRVCVDTSAILERELAAAAGVGWIGKNTMVLTPSLGSFFFLGEIITDLVLEPDGPMPDHCGSCTRCLEACPTAAFPEPRVMDAGRCISYLTIEHRGEIEPALAEKMDGWVFGCDICQEVCPYNHRAPLTNEPRFRGTPGSVHPVLDDILSWDEVAYLTCTRGKATRRAKLPMWKRNAEIAKSRTGNGSP